MANITVFENAERELYYQLASGSPEVVLTAEDARALLNFVHNTVDYINDVKRDICDRCYFNLGDLRDRVRPSATTALKDLDALWFT